MCYLKNSRKHVNRAIHLSSTAPWLLWFSYFRILSCSLSFIALFRTFSITYVISMWRNKYVDNLDPLSVGRLLIPITAGLPWLVRFTIVVTGHVISETHGFLRGVLAVPSFYWLSIQLHNNILLYTSRTAWFGLLLILLEINIWVVWTAPHRFRGLSLRWRAAETPHGWHECLVFVLIQDSFPEGRVQTFVQRVTPSSLNQWARLNAIRLYVKIRGCNRRLRRVDLISF